MKRTYTPEQLDRINFWIARIEMLRSLKRNAERDLTKCKIKTQAE